MEQLGKLIVDGMFFDNLPSRLDQLVDDDYGVRQDNHVTVYNRRQMVLESATTDDFKQKRKIHRQAWRFGWERDSLASNELHELLTELYETQRPFWIQADDEMSRCWGRCITVGNEIHNAAGVHAFFTPTYPVYPFGHEPGDDSDDWTDMLLVGSELWDDPFTVNNELGIVLIEPNQQIFNHRSRVHLKYTWRAYVRIKSLTMMAHQLAQTYYTGEIEIEQLPIPQMGAELVWRDEPYTASCIQYGGDQIHVFGQVRIAANIRMAEIVTGSVQGIARVRGFVRALRTGVVGTPINKVIGVQFAPILQPLRILGTVNGYSSGQTMQILRPNGDLNVVWSVTNAMARWSAIDDPVVNESDSIEGSYVEQRGTFTPASDPGIHTNHAVKVVWHRLTSVSTVLTIKIYDGEVLIAAPQFTASVDGRLDSSYTLSSGEAAAISNYTNLRWGLSASSNASVASLWLEFPVVGGVVIKARSATGVVQILGVAAPDRSIITGNFGINVVAVTAKVIGTKESDGDDDGDNPDDP